MDRNTQDGGEAILEAFRNLGVDYIMSSPGSEWGPLWEALARQKVGNKAGPAYLSCWHETLAVNLAWGYTTVTGRPRRWCSMPAPGFCRAPWRSMPPTPRARPWW